MYTFVCLCLCTNGCMNMTILPYHAFHLCAQTCTTRSFPISCIILKYCSKTAGNNGTKVLSAASVASIRNFREFAASTWTGNSTKNNSNYEIILLFVEQYRCIFMFGKRNDFRRVFKGQNKSQSIQYQKYLDWITVRINTWLLKSNGSCLKCMIRTVW